MCAIRAFWNNRKDHREAMGNLSLGINVSDNFPKGLRQTSIKIFVSQQDRNSPDIITLHICL